MKTWIFAALVASLLVVGIVWLLSLATQSDSKHAEPEFTHLVKYETRDIADVCGPKTTKEVSRLIEDSRTCVLDEDCTLIEGEHCPFGCTIPVNKQYEETVHSTLHEVIETVERVCGTSCVYSCAAVEGAICENRKCIAVSGVKHPPPLITEQPPVPSYDG